MRMKERTWAAANRIASADSNPALRFQEGDIVATDMPNFAQYYNYDTTGLYHYGLRIPTADSFITDYEEQFGTTPELTAAELALIGRAATAPPRAILPYRNFSISSTRGVIAPADFRLITGLDFDGNGTEDCLDSFTGYNSSLDGAGSFGVAGGCWVMGDDGQPRPFDNGLVAGNFNAFGGDGIELYFDDEIIIPREDRVAVNFTGRYELTPTLTAFGEAKYVYSDVETGTPYNTFWDLLYGAPDNPFLPEALRPLAEDAGGLFITRDNIDIGPNSEVNERHTMRFVAGLEGTIAGEFAWEVSANYGEFRRKQTEHNFLVSDRWFAAIDVVEDPATGQPICRSDIDSTPPPTTVFGIPEWDSGFFTFTPGDGQCRPANIWAGVGGISQEAIDFFTTTVVNEDTITQAVLSATLVGDSARLFSLPAGAIGFAVGAEWREEKSRARFDPMELGIIPAGAPYPEGTLVDAVSGNGTLGFDGSGKLNNTEGRYDVYDLFGEISIPILRDLPFASELSIDGAYRFSDYSTIGTAGTWKAGAVWAPVNDIRFRGTVSQAVRAPNIFELFSPDQATFFRPIDPCDQREINALAEADPGTAAIREANCRAAGIPAGFEDPLSARFAGVSGGNADLYEETADTTTIGVILQPRFFTGLTVSADYWDISVEDAISAVSAQDIVDNCYDSPTFPNDYCELFTRNGNAASAQYLGFNFLRQTQVNFGKIEATGLDLAAQYAFRLGGHGFVVRAQATRQYKLDYFFDPGDLSAVDPELGELFRPKWAGNTALAWQLGPFQATWSLQYIGRQALRNVEIETYDTLYGEAAIADPVYLHGLSVQYALNDAVMLFGGMENITDEKPYITEYSWPTGPRGRYVFLGGRMSL